jgi:hypothetical protein
MPRKSFYSHWIGIPDGKLLGKLSASGEIAEAPSVKLPGVWFPTMLTEGAWAEVKVGTEHLRLFSEHNAQGVQASVYNVNTRSWIAPSEPVEDIEQGKEKAAKYARAHLKHAANSELPPLQWKNSRSR